MPFGGAQVAAMMKGPLGVDVVRNGLVTRGFFDDGTRVVVDDMGQSYEVEGTAVHTASVDPVLAGLAQDETITVDGVTFLTGAPTTQGAGAIRVIPLRRA